MLTESLVLNGRLFPIPQAQRRPNGPIFDGWFQVHGEHGRFRGAAWVRTATSGAHKDEEFLSLQLEPLNERGHPQKVFGALFRVADKRSHNSADHYGRLNITEERDGPTLKISGWDKETENGSYISLLIEPYTKDESQKSTKPTAQESATKAQRPPLPV